MKQTENYGFEKPDIKEFFKLETWKNNMDKIDETIKKREAEQKITNEEIKKIKNVQFTQADERKNIESKETLPVLFGKIAKWLADLKTVAFSGNYNDLSNKPTIPAVVNNNTTTEAGFALDARQANPNVDGSLAKQISTLNSGLKNKHCNGVQREHNKKLNNGLPILHKVPPKRDYGRYFCIMAEKGGTSHGGLTEKLSLFFHAKKQEVNAYGR